MKITVKKRYLLEFFFLLFFLLFFGFRFIQFTFFQIHVSSSDGLPFSFLLFYYFKRLGYMISSGKYALITMWISIILLLLTILLIFVLSFIIVKFFEKLHIQNNIFFKKAVEVFDKIFSLKQAYIIIFLFVLSFVIRLIYINDGLFHHDSVQIALATEKTLLSGEIQSAVGERYGLVLINAIIFAIPYFIFGVKSSELTITLMTILFAALSVVMLYLFTKELIKSEFAVVSAALFLSFNPIFLSVTTYAKDHSYALFFILLAGYALIKAIKTNLNFYKILFGLSSGFLLLVRISDIVSLIPFGMIYLLPQKFIKENEIKLKERYNFRNLIFIIVPFLLIVIPFLIYKYYAIIGLSAANKFLQIQGLTFENLVSIIFTLTPLGSFLLFYWLFFKIKDEKYITIFLVGWFILVFVFYSSFMSAKIRFFVPLIIPLSILLALALDVIKKNYTFLVSTLMLVIIIVSMLIFIHPVIAYRHNYSSGKELVSYMLKLTEKNALIIDYGDFLVFYDYYGKQLNVTNCPLTDDVKEFQNEINLIHTALVRGQPVYINEYCFVFAPPQQVSLLYGTLSINYNMEVKGEVTVDAYDSAIKTPLRKYKIYRLNIKKR